MRFLSKLLVVVKGAGLTALESESLRREAVQPHEMAVHASLQLYLNSNLGLVLTQLLYCYNYFDLLKKLYPYNRWFECSYNGIKVCTSYFPFPYGNS